MAVETYFPCIYTIKKIRKERLGGGGLAIRASERGVIFEKNIPGNVGMMNPSFDCLLYNTRRDLVHCSNLSSFLSDSKK